MNIPIVGQTFEIEGYQSIICTADPNADAKAFAKANGIEVSEAKYILETLYGSARSMDGVTDISDDEKSELATDDDYDISEAINNLTNELGENTTLNQGALSQLLSELQQLMGTNTSASATTGITSKTSQSEETKNGYVASNAVKSKLIAIFDDYADYNKASASTIQKYLVGQIHTPGETKLRTANYATSQNALNSLKQLDSLSEAAKKEIVESYDSENYTALELMYLSGMTAEEAGAALASILSETGASYDENTKTLTLPRFIGDNACAINNSSNTMKNLVNQYITLFQGKVEYTNENEYNTWKKNHVAGHEDATVSNTGASTNWATADVDESYTEEQIDLLKSFNSYNGKASNMGFVNYRILGVPTGTGKGKLERESYYLDTPTELKARLDNLSDKEKEILLTMKDTTKCTRVELMYLSGMSRDQAGYALAQVYKKMGVEYNSETQTLEANCPSPTSCNAYTTSYRELVAEFEALFPKGESNPNKKTTSTTTNTATNSTTTSSSEKSNETKSKTNQTNLTENTRASYLKSLVKILAALLENFKTDEAEKEEAEAKAEEEAEAKAKEEAEEKEA